jgi:hypothetical protein
LKNHIQSAEIVRKQLEREIHFSVHLPSLLPESFVGFTPILVLFAQNVIDFVIQKSVVQIDFDCFVHAGLLEVAGLEEVPEMHDLPGNLLDSLVEN